MSRLAGGAMALRPAVLGLTVIAALLLTACYDDPDVTLHEPGDYEGPSDPLLSKLDDAKLQQALEQRFANGQTDR